MSPVQACPFQLIGPSQRPQHIPTTGAIRMILCSRRHQRFVRPVSSVYFKCTCRLCVSVVLVYWHFCFICKLFRYVTKLFFFNFNLLRAYSHRESNNIFSEFRHEILTDGDVHKSDDTSYQCICCASITLTQRHDMYQTRAPAGMGGGGH